jgi:hypothetical protein
MMNYCFAEMEIKSLRNYIIQNLNDKEAFYFYIDSLKSSSSGQIYSSSLSPEEIKKVVNTYFDKK